MSRPRRFPAGPLRLPVGAAVLLAAVCTLASCADPSDTTPQGPTVSTSPAALMDKLDSIVQDECMTSPAAEVFPDCGRFATELTNAANTAEGDLNGRPPSEVVRAAAQRMHDDLATFSSHACIAQPGSPTPVVPTCTADLERVRTDLTDLRTALEGAGTAAPTG